MGNTDEATDGSRVVAQGGSGIGPASAQGGIGFDTQMVVDGVSELLIASEISLGRLNRDVPDQELDLVQLAAGQMA